MLKLIKHEFTKSKKDNIYQLHIEFSEKCWGIGMDYLESNKLILSIEDCNDNPLLEAIISIPEQILNSFEFMSYDLSKNKTELYVYFYEFPYEDNDIEIIFSDSIKVINTETNLNKV